jgi:hypothetical protein
MRWLSFLRNKSRPASPAVAVPRVRWFFALNENSPGFWEYANLVQVAVDSARRHTTLLPVCIYEGGENALTLWLRAAGVTVFFRRTFLHQWVPDMPPIPRGAFLRLEIPALCREQHWDDEYVLYTDCDVVFLRDVVPALRELRPRFFAVAPEIERTNFERFNSGVMWMHVPVLAAEMPALTETIRTHLDEAIAPPYDQAMLQRHFAGRADRLPLELNWKPYWGANAEAVILHFHGPKPAQRYFVLNGRAPSDLVALGTSEYFAAARRWEDALYAALGRVPWDFAATEAGVATGFAGYDAAEGLSAPEGPLPEVMVPVVRWGLPPRTTLTFSVGAGERVRLETIFQCDHTDQAMSLTLDDRPLTHVAIRRAAEPTPLLLDLPAEAGAHRLVFEYARSYPQPGSQRAVAMLFRAIRIKRF